MEEALRGAFPDREVINRADVVHHNRDLSGIDYAVVWKSAPDLFERAPDLKVVFSGGAGVDHVLTLPGLPEVPLVRFVDQTLTTRMSEWVVMQCLLHLRQHRAYEALAAKREWRDLSQPEAADITVGIMGMGVLGQDAARKLSTMGFKVVGWSRSKKNRRGHRNLWRQRTRQLSRPHGFPRRAVAADAGHPRHLQSAPVCQA